MHYNYCLIVIFSGYLYLSRRPSYVLSSIFTYFHLPAEYSRILIKEMYALTDRIRSEFFFYILFFVRSDALSSESSSGCVADKVKLNSAL